MSSPSHAVSLLFVSLVWFDYYYHWLLSVDIFRAMAGDRSVLPTLLWEKLPRENTWTMDVYTAGDDGTLHSTAAVVCVRQCADAGKKKRPTKNVRNQGPKNTAPRFAKRLKIFTLQITWTQVQYNK